MKMSELIKAIITFVFTGISAFFKMYGIAVFMLLLSIIFDIISGTIAAKITGKKNKEDFKKGLLKKSLIIMLVIFAWGIDLLLLTYAGITIHFVFLLTTFFQITCEALSFIKNLEACGIEMPGFLKKLIKNIKDKTDKGDNNITA
jgi:toxin secretion/phage lysis holin